MKIILVKNKICPEKDCDNIKPVYEIIFHEYMDPIYLCEQHLGLKILEDGDKVAPLKNELNVANKRLAHFEKIHKQAFCGKCQYNQLDGPGYESHHYCTLGRSKWLCNHEDMHRITALESLSKTQIELITKLKADLTKSVQEIEDQLCTNCLFIELSKNPLKHSREADELRKLIFNSFFNRKRLLTFRNLLIQSKWADSHEETIDKLNLLLGEQNEEL